jgi:hypothetical protein
MKVVSITDGPDDESRFEDMDQGTVIEWDSHRLRLQEVPAGSESPLHPEPSPAMATVLKGWIRITTSLGDSRTLHPGDAMLFLDTQGKGHAFVTAPETSVLMIVGLAQGGPR